jgi:hypothetical protein
MFDELGVWDRITFTPAERALMVEQSELMLVSLRTFISQCKDGTARSVVDAAIPVNQAHEYMQAIVKKKIQRAMQEVGME